ncbi:MAG: sensor histidine kinase, partial [Chitinophagaceae bacterium]|nr:sensor histidine kinase [Chitinophagaceae bacterium]
LTYFSLHDYKNYYSYSLQSKNAFIASKRFSDTLDVNTEIGLALVSLGRTREGLLLLERTREALKVSGDEESYAIATDNLSNAYLELNRYEEALKYQLELSTLPWTKSSLETITGVNQHLAEILIELKRYREAQPYLTQALEAATKMGSVDWLFDCYKNQSAIYEAQGNYKEALRYHQLFKTLKDSVYQQEYDTKISAMASFYALGEKEHQIGILEKERLMNQAKIQQLSLIIAILVVLVLLIVLFIIHRKNKLEKKLKEQFSARLIQAQEDERFRISRELHDSVGQNILFIKNQIQKLIPDRNPLLNQSVDEALEEVRSISKNLYPNQLEQYGLVSALIGLCDRVKESTNLFVSHEMQIPEQKLSKTIKINCYRMIQECINNSLKHAAATAIRITAELKENALELIVQDNGIGFEKHNLHQKANHSFGMLNLQERAKLLQGKFDVISAPGQGTKSVFTIPIP